jgi:uncharacterized protein YrzB (UPF0473 family)
MENENKNKKEMDTEIQEDDEIITLTYDDGTEEKFFEIAELDFEGKWYIYLQPMDNEEGLDEEEVIIYEISEDEKGEELFLPVNDEKLMNKLVELLNKELEK